MQPGERLIQEGLFRLNEAGEPRLLGSRCSKCGAVFGSRRQVCLACFGREMEEHLVAPDGTVRSFTTVHQAGGGVILDVPYVIAQVALAENVVATAPVLDCKPEQVAVGTKVRGKALRFKDDGDTVVSWAFALVDGEGEVTA